ncbi:hypothetical protein [Cellulomonas sp. URHE0023]|uniref:hypothetical protein n=1 Tax=Cellulomonas sp. URHE0023 TaxID=1380354 RepID=UPI00047FC0FD|nr:hypothetical protein [Cellulomonas sp. URHE0023]
MPRHLKPYIWALGIVWGLPVVAVVLGWVFLPHDNPDGACEGIGFGCSPSPADGLLIVAAMFGVPILTGVGLLVCGVIALMQYIGRPRVTTALQPRSRSSD